MRKKIEVLIAYKITAKIKKSEWFIIPPPPLKGSRFNVGALDIAFSSTFIYFVN